MKSETDKANAHKLNTSGNKNRWLDRGLTALGVGSSATIAANNGGAMFKAFGRRSLDVSHEGAVGDVAVVTTKELLGRASFLGRREAYVAFINFLLDENAWREMELDTSLGVGF